jgi:hypothetical protein
MYSHDPMDTGASTSKAPDPSSILMSHPLNLGSTAGKRRDNQL